MQNLENQTEQNLLKNNVERNNKYRIYLHMYELTMTGNLYFDSIREFSLYRNNIIR